MQGVGGEAGSGLSDVPIGDLGTHRFEEDVTWGLLENEERIIEEIQAALTRLDRGTFGDCVSCRRTIPTKRLRAIPYARHCVGCALRLQETIVP